MGKNIQFQHLDWDSSYFDAKTEKITITSPLTETEKMLFFDNISQNDFIVIYNRENNSIINNFLGEKTSAFLTDLNIQFKKNIFNRSKNLEDFIEISNYFQFNKQITEIVENSFIFSRFYNDPHINNKKADLLYKHWVNNSFNSESKYFITYYDKGNLVGFLLFSISNKVLTVELICTDMTARFNGIGTKLLCALDNFAIDNQINEIRVGTQINNINAVKFYSKNNYIVDKVTSIYHIWNTKERK